MAASPIEPVRGVTGGRVIEVDRSGDRPDLVIWAARHAGPVAGRPRAWRRGRAWRGPVPHRDAILEAVAAVLDDFRAAGQRRALGNATITV